MTSPTNEQPIPDDPAVDAEVIADLDAADEDDVIGGQPCPGGSCGGSK